jgi:hypothetical protein
LHRRAARSQRQHRRRFQSTAAVLQAQGTADRPIRFVARDAQPWGALRIQHPATASLAHVELEGGGGDRFIGFATINVIGDRMPGARPMLTVDDVSITGSRGVGVRLISSAGFGPGSNALTVTGSGADPVAPGQPIVIGVQSAGTLPDGDYGGNRVGSIILDGDAIITEDVRLRDLGLPYETAPATEVRVRDATMAIDPGVTVRLVANQAWQIGASPNVGGELVAEGTAEKPVTFAALVAGQKWGHITAQAPGTVSLTHTILEDGGSDRFRSFATLVSWGDGALPVDANLLVDHVTVRRSVGAGALVDRYGGFAPGSTDFTITESGGVDFGYPLHVTTPAVGTIPPGSYGGNALEEILINAVSIVGSDTFPDRGLPYVLPFGLSVSPPNDGPPALLTIEPGVTLRFGEGAFLRFGAGSSGSAPVIGLLHAVGTAEKPIVFTGTTQTAGFWRGLVFAGVGNDENRIDHARIEYAGADCSCSGFGCSPDEDAGVIFFNYRPPSAFITNTTFAHIDGHGVTSGWSSDLEGPNFKATNTFEDIKGCQQVHWKGMNGSCPDVCY